MSTKTIGVVLSGCGFLDGAEIHEATLTLLALDRAGVKYRCMAPSVPQMHVVDHSTSTPQEGAERNVLQESARIARCEISDLATVQIGELDALIFPGGFGAAKNLCTFATEGPSCTVNPDVERLIRGMYEAQKPLGFICIAPAIAAKVLGEYGPTLTIGNDAGTAEAIEALGAVHQECPVQEAVVDQKHRIVTTPAYMLGPNIAAVSDGIEQLVSEVLAFL